MASIIFQPVIVIMVGYPGSGKSTFASELVRRAPRRGQFWNQRWIRVSQDEMGSRREYEIAVENHLREGGSVVVDRCNIDIAQRSIWIRMGHANNALVISVFCDTPFYMCASRVMRRSRFDHPTLHGDMKSMTVMTVMRRFESSFVFPMVHEGFRLCYHLEPNRESFDSTIQAILEHYHSNS